MENSNRPSKTRTTDEWCAAFRDIDVRYAPVRDYRQVVEDPGAWENGYFAEVRDADGTAHRVVGTPIRMSETPLKPGAVAPALGEHTDEILREADTRMKKSPRSARRGWFEALDGVNYRR